MNLSVDKIYEDLKRKYQRNDSFVIVIGPNGEVEEDNLEAKPYNHGLSTNYLAMKMGCRYLDSSNPYEAGIYLCDQGYLVVHLDYNPSLWNGVGLCFFPKKISVQQYEVFMERMKRFDEVMYQYIGCLDEEHFLSFDEIVAYAKGIIGDIEEKNSKKSR